ncbi:hypothetical protein FRE64_06445 [Euhalothece natronophila Z-M001]|uniref:Uncharacterized protein n=1 Tax=Euhalothece natronophila Z-M001 TaxID=522448 RepID=A0A5B8NK24_9CHRO|nr:hypothetical protein [Euhalothece natronophila]QDZ39602.1 hypothetical protein FRE64_06445 [Euhalothece natronophila Z-M001]
METGDLSMNSEFQTMTIKELKKYVLENRNDHAAFQALMERVDEQPERQAYGEVDSVQFFELVQEYRRSKSDDK